MSEVNTYNIVIHQGATWYFTMTVYDENDTAENLTGYSAVMQVRDKPGGKLLATFSTANTLIAALDSTGKIAITVPAETTKTYTWRNGVYDIYIKHSSGDPVVYLLKGDFRVDARTSQ